jgi:hypothetical protein
LPHLPAAAVYEAIAYYYDHQAEIDAELDANSEAAIQQQLRQSLSPEQYAKLTGRETFDILGITDDIAPRQELTVKATKEDGSVITFQVTARLDTPVEANYYKNGGILPTVLRKLVQEG